jgi:hypothetical protein
VGDEIDRVAEQLAREGVIRTDLAEQILKEWRNKPS